eukprot:jgi/Tetstr1/430469/TSEL_020277.t1
MPPAQDGGAALIHGPIGIRQRSGLEREALAMLARPGAYVRGRAEVLAAVPAAGEAGDSERRSNSGTAAIQNTLLRVVKQASDEPAEDGTPRSLASPGVAPAPAAPHLAPGAEAGGSPPLCDSRRHRSAPVLSGSGPRCSASTTAQRDGPGAKATADTGGPRSPMPSPISRVGSVMGHVDSVSDGLCEWPSISTGLDGHLEAGGGGATPPPTPPAAPPPQTLFPSALPSSPGPAQKMHLLRQQDHLSYARPAERGGCHYYIRRASRSGLPEMLEGDGADEAGAGHGEEGVAPARLLRSLAVTGSMYSLGTANGQAAPPPRASLPHNESFSSEPGGSSGGGSPPAAGGGASPPLGGRSVFHTKRLLEAAVARFQGGGRFLNPGGIVPLLAMLEEAAAAPAPGREVAAQLEALALLAHSATNASIIATAGGLPLLARLLAHGGTGTSVSAGSAAADALGALAATVPGLRPAMLASGAVPGLLWLLRVGGPAPRGAATRALCLLADDPSGVDALRQGGAVSAALQALAGIPGAGRGSRRLAAGVLSLLARLGGCLGDLRAAAAALGGDRMSATAKVLCRLELQWVAPARGAGLVALPPAEEADFLTDLSAEVALLGYRAPAGDPPSEPPSRQGSLVQYLAATSIPRWRTYGDASAATTAIRFRAPGAGLPCPSATVGSDLDRLPGDGGGSGAGGKMHKVASCPVVAGCS